MIKWKSLRTAPKSGFVMLLGTTDARLEELRQIEGEWDDELGIYVSKAGWCISAVAWRDTPKNLTTEGKSAPEQPAKEQGDGMCSEDDPAVRCICREEFGHRVCKPAKEQGHE